MPEIDSTTHWWLEPGEQIVRQVRSSAKYQYANSMVRRGFPATFFLTDRRLVAVSHRGRSARRRVLPMDVPRDRIQGFDVVEAMRTGSSNFRPWMGRRILRLDIDHQGRDLVVGIVLAQPEAEAWITALHGKE